MTRLLSRASRLGSLFQTPSLDRWLQQAFDEDLPALSTDLRLPKADIAETENEYLITLELPGMEPEEIEVEQIGHHVRVRGERRRESEQKGKRFHRTERTYGAFERSFELPPSVRANPESIQAEFHRGMLEIRVAKLEPQPAARIPVGSGDTTGTGSTVRAEARR
jgi:HSP20 family protein